MTTRVAGFPTTTSSKTDCASLDLWTYWRAEVAEDGAEETPRGLEPSPGTDQLPASSFAFAAENSSSLRIPADFISASSLSFDIMSLLAGAGVGGC